MRQGFPEDFQGDRRWQGTRQDDEKPAEPGNHEA